MAVGTGGAAGVGVTETEVATTTEDNTMTAEETHTKVVLSKEAPTKEAHTKAYLPDPEQNAGRHPQQAPPHRPPPCPLRPLPLARQTAPTTVPRP